MEQKTIQLTHEEMAIFKPFSDACDARLQGHSEANEAAKASLLNLILSGRQAKQPAVVPAQTHKNGRKKS